MSAPSTLRRVAVPSVLLGRPAATQGDAIDHADALCTVSGLDTPVGPGSTGSAVTIVNAMKVRVSALLTKRGVMLPVISRSSVVGEERSREPFDQAYREHARRIARAIDQPSGGE